MKIQVLGSAAGGGFPQWNCSCPNCLGHRENPQRFRARHQSSIAVSTNDRDWVLINASPDIRQQIAAFPPLQAQPHDQNRDTGVRGIVLVDSQIDHTTGLLILREGKPLKIYSTQVVKDDLTRGYPIFNLLSSYCGVNWHEIDLHRPNFEVEGAADIQFRAIALTSNAPPYSPHRDKPVEGNNIALVISNRQNGQSVFYAPGMAELGDEALQAMREANLLLVDGTFWSDDEMKIVGKSRTARAMGHLPLDDDQGLLKLLENFPTARKVLIHINNTNPILDEESIERKTVLSQGVEISYDGMTLEV